jgi:hypothetical protein
MEPSDRPEHDDEICPTLDRPCFGCHTGSLTVGLGRDFPTRTRSKTPPRVSDNSYNKGIPVMERPGGTVMPYLRKDGETMGQREFDQKRRQIEENRRKAHNAPVAP